MNIMKTFKLDNEPKIGTGFTAPDNYFDTFSEKVMQQLQKEEPKTISIFSRRKTWTYAAAAVLVIGLSIPIYNKLQNRAAEIDQATLENYITYHTNVTDADIVNLLDEKDIQKIKIDLDIDDKAIENELAEDNIDITY